MQVERGMVDAENDGARSRAWALRAAPSPTSGVQHATNVPLTALSAAALWA